MKEINPRGARNDSPGVLSPVGTTDPGLSEQNPTAAAAAWGGAGPGTASPGKDAPQGCGFRSVEKPGQAPGGNVQQMKANTVSDMGYGPGFISKPANGKTNLAGAATSDPNSNGTSSPAANPGPTGIGISGVGAPLT